MALATLTPRVWIASLPGEAMSSCVAVADGRRTERKERAWTSHGKANNWREGLGGVNARHEQFPVIDEHNGAKVPLVQA